jgi:hypothetical protein
MISKYTNQRKDENFNGFSFIEQKFYQKAIIVEKQNSQHTEDLRKLIYFYISTSDC